MLTRHKLAIAAMVVTALPSSANAAITVTTESYPPFNLMHDTEVVGTATDLVKATFEKAGVPYAIQLLPWARAYDMALHDPDTCVYSTTVTPERQALFQWVGPLVTNNWTLFAKDDAAPVASLDAVKGKTIGGYNASAPTLYLQSLGQTVEAATKDDLNPAKLANGRIDYWVSGAQLGPYLAEQLGIKNIKPVLTFKQVEMSLACNKAMDPALIAKLQAALAAVRHQK